MQWSMKQESHDFSRVECQSYTRLDRDVIPDFDLIPFEYLELDLKEAEQKIKEDYGENENNNPTD